MTSDHPIAERRGEPTGKISRPAGRIEWWETNFLYLFDEQRIYSGLEHGILLSSNLYFGTVGVSESDEKSSVSSNSGFPSASVECLGSLAAYCHSPDRGWIAPRKFTKHLSDLSCLHIIVAICGIVSRKWRLQKGHCSQWTRRA